MRGGVYTTLVLLACLLASGFISPVAHGQKVELSPEQKKFISDHAPIRVGVTPEWAPFSYFDKSGQPKGIDVDLLNIISARTGLKFEIVPGEVPWDELWRMAKAGELDVTTSTVETEHRKKVFSFSRPYAKSSSVIVSRGGDLRFRHLSLLRTATIAQPRRYIVSTAVTNRLPSANVIWFDTQSECFTAVARGEVDATVADLFTATQYMNDHPRMKLGISGAVPDLQFPLSMGVRKDYGVLVETIDQVLATIPQEELDAMMSQHLLFTLQAGQRLALLKKRIIYVLAGSIAIVSLFFIWNCLIRKEMLARRDAERELREINQSLEVFSHSIAHDLRAPLRAITGLAEAVQQDYAEQLDAVGKDYLKRIVQAALRMENLVRDVLLYSQASRSEFKMQNVSLQQVVSQLIGEFPAAQRPYFRIVSELPNVRGHPALLAQCLANLFTNAIKFVPEGRTPDIRIRAEQSANGIRVWVEDNGIGIAPEDQQRIFKVFQRGTNAYAGTGIGLAVVKKGVERMSGDVGVESELGNGSRFWIELPKPDFTDPEKS